MSCETGSVLFATVRCDAMRCDAMEGLRAACGCWLKPEEQSCETRSVFARRGPGAKSEWAESSRNGGITSSSTATLG